MLGLALMGPGAPTCSGEQRVNPGINLEKTLVLYGELSGRTVLRHPSLWTGHPFAFTSTATNHSEILRHIEVALAEHKIAVVPDGEKFVLIGLTSQQAELTPGATNIIANATKIYPRGSIHIVNTSIAQVLPIYAGYSQKRLEPGDPVPPIISVSLVQTTDLTREECLYAFETLLRWHGWKLVPVGADAVKPVRLPREPEQPTKP